MRERELHLVMNHERTNGIIAARYELNCRLTHIIAAETETEAKPLQKLEGRST